MSESKSVGLRIPDEILTEINSRIGIEGRNRSEVILALIQRGLGLKPVSQSNEMVERLEEIEKKVALLEDVHQRLHSVEQTLRQPSKRFSQERTPSTCK